MCKRTREQETILYWTIETFCCRYCCYWLVGWFIFAIIWNRFVIEICGGWIDFIWDEKCLIRVFTFDDLVCRYLAMERRPHVASSLDSLAHNTLSLAVHNWPMAMVVDAQVVVVKIQSNLLIIFKWQQKFDIFESVKYFHRKTPNVFVRLCDFVLKKLSFILYQNSLPGGGNDGYPMLAFDCALNDWFRSECGLDVPDEWPSERFVQLSPDDPFPLSNIVVAYGVGLSGDWNVKQKLKLIDMFDTNSSFIGVKNQWAYFATIIKGAQISCINFGIIRTAVRVISLWQCTWVAQ